MSEYKLVPVEPTEEMLAAGEAASFESISWDTAKWVYEAMLAAAPEVQEGALADRMRAAGMMTIDEMMDKAPFDRFIRHAGVHDLDSYGQWLDMKCRDFLTMQAKRELNKDPEDDMYEWVIAHAAAFQEARINFNAARRAKAEQQPVGWHTEDHLDDKSATTYSAKVAQRWRDKGWPVWPLYTTPQPAELQPAPEVARLVDLLRDIGEVCRQLEMPSERAIAGWAERIDAALADYRKGDDV